MNNQESAFLDKGICGEKGCENPSASYWKFNWGEKQYIMERCSEHPPDPELVKKWEMSAISEDKYIILRAMNE